MDKTALVSVDIETGAEILRALDRAGLKISVAAWVLLAEYQEWRLLLASRKLDTVGLFEKHRLVGDALDAAEFPVERVPPLLILRMNDPSIRQLRQSFAIAIAKAQSVEGMRLGGMSFGDRFIEDGYAYRIS